MIGKITGGASFGGALEYLTQPKEKSREHDGQEERLEETPPMPDEHAPPYEEGERHRVIGGNMCGQTREELTREFEAISQQRPDIEKPVHHASLSAGEHDEISVDDWREIAAEYVEKMGYKDAPYVLIQHRDGNRDHVHILTSRVDLRGQVISDWQCKRRAETVLRDVERSYGLEQVKSSSEVERAAPSRRELERFNRTGELSAKMALQGHVELALKDNPTATEFIERLRLSGVEVIPYIQLDGRATGISFSKENEMMKGRDLGRGFTWNALQRRGLNYDYERDRPAIEAARERAADLREGNISLQPEQRGIVDFNKSVGREVGQYLLDSANPIRQIESQMHMIEQGGRGIAEGVSALRDLVMSRDEAGSSSRPYSAETSEREAFDRLQQAAGFEPTEAGHDALEKLNIAGSKADSINALDTVLQPQWTPALEPAAEEQVFEQAIEFLL